jgi:hypothetical protein
MEKATENNDFPCKLQKNEKKNWEICPFIHLCGTFFAKNREMQEIPQKFKDFPHQNTRKP